MKKIMAILLVSLLGFFGCSDSDDGTSNFNGKAVPVAPFAYQCSNTPTYQWTSVPEATRYQLLVEQRYDQHVLIEEWYTAEEAGCASGEPFCSETPNVEVMGIGCCTWKVMACAGEECGVMSDERQFECKGAEGGENDRRFIDNGDGTVTDTSTELMWTKDAGLAGRSRRHDRAVALCKDRVYAGYDDWRLPAVWELPSVLDACSVTPEQYRDFINVSDTLYWTYTRYDPYHICAPGVCCESAYCYGMSEGLVAGELCVTECCRRSWESEIWCVRAGPNPFE